MDAGQVKFFGAVGVNGDLTEELHRPASGFKVEQMIWDRVDLPERWRPGCIGALLAEFPG